MSGTDYQLGIRLSASGAEGVATQVNKLETTVKGLAAALAGAFTVKEFVGWMKTAVDAGDEMKAFSQKTGVAVAEVAGLKLAFKQGGVEGDALTSAMGKLSKNMVAGSDAFETLGVKTRNTDGSMRSVKDVLYDVADATKDMGDGARKSALLQEVLGKSANDLIPTLNEGSDGMRKMADMAEKLGLSMSSDAAEAADGFNDTLELLGMGLQGIARQTMAQLLPTLNNLTGAFLDTMTKGDALSKVSATLAAALKLLFASGVLVVEAFQTVGKTIGAAGAAVVAVMSGDFAGAARIGKEHAQDVKGSWRDTADTIGKAWAESGNGTVNVLAKVVKAQTELGVKTKEEEATQKAAAAEVQKHAAELDKLAASTRAESAGLSGDFFAKWDKLNELRSTGRITVAELEDAQARLLKQQPFLVEANKQLADSQKAAMEALGAVTAAELKEADTVAALVERQREHNAQIGLTKEQLGLLEVAKINDALATAEQRLQDALKVPTDAAVLDAITLQVEGLRELKALKKEGVIQQATVDTAKAAGDAWAKTTDDIGKGLTDSLFRAFESGKGFFDTLWQGIVNTFKTTVLQPTIRAIMAPITGSIGSMFGGTAQAGGAAGAAGQGGSMLSSLGSMAGLGSMSGLGSIFSAGASLTGFTGAGTGMALEGAGAMMANGSIAGGAAQGLGALAPWAAGIGVGVYGGRAISGGYGSNATVNVGTAIGAAVAGPIGAAIGGAIGGLANRTFGMKDKETQAQGIEGSISGGDATGQAYKDWYQRGGWARKSKKGTEKSAMGEDVAALMDLGAKAILDQTKGWAAALKLPADTLASVTTTFKTKLTGDAKADGDAIAAVLDTYQSALSDKFAAAAAPFQKAGETVADTLARLSALTQFSDALNSFGGVFSSIAAASVGARENLIGLAGGIEALAGKSAQFVSDYYTQGEQAGLQAVAVRDAMKALGLDGSALGSRDDFRALVDSLGAKIEDSSAQKQLVGLLDIGPQFAKLGDYLKEQKLSLEDAAKSAPRVELLQGIMADNSKAQLQTQADQLAAGRETNALLKAGFDRMFEALAAGFAAVSANTSATTEQLRRWDDGGALVTVAQP